MPLYEVSQYTTLEEARAPQAFAALAAFARRHLMSAPGEEGRASVITGKDEIPRRQRALFDVLARFGAHIEDATASLVGLHENSLDGPRWLELLDALAALPRAAFLATTVSVDWVDGRWKAFPEARCFVAMDNHKRADFEVWAALRVDAPRAKSDRVGQAVDAIASATGIPFQKSRPEILEVQYEASPGLPTVEDVRRAFALVGDRLREQGLVPRPASPARSSDGVVDFEAIRRQVGRTMHSDSPWVHHSEAGLFQSAAAPAKARTNVTAVLRKHLVAGLAGFVPAPDRKLEWWKPVGDRLVIGLSVERLSGKGVGRMLTMGLIVREAGSEAVIARHAVGKWFGAPHGSCLTYVDGTDLGATLERIAPVLSRGIEQMVVELSAAAATST